MASTARSTGTKFGISVKLVGMKLLNGLELAGYIKERQAKQVRTLRQAHATVPRLAIVQTIDDPVIDTYVKKLKQQYAEDILVTADHYKVSQEELMSTIERLNADDAVHGIIIQLPLADLTSTDDAVRAVSPLKDVDGLGEAPVFDPATALAINWLCAGYNIELEKHKILIVGSGRLVGAPLARMWQNSGFDVTVVDSKVEDLAYECQQASLIVSGTGVPGLIKSDMVRPETVLIDAGTVAESGVIVGDLSPDLYKRHDLIITPQKGGVGPLTVCALFENVIRAARATTAS